MLRAILEDVLELVSLTLFLGLIFVICIAV